MLILVHLRPLQEIVYIERTINFHSATTRYQGDASLVHRHPDQILGDPDLHIPVGYCAVGIGNASSYFERD